MSLETVQADQSKEASKGQDVGVFRQSTFVRRYCILYMLNHLPASFLQKVHACRVREALHMSDWLRLIRLL